MAPQRSSEVPDMAALRGASHHFWDRASQQRAPVPGTPMYRHITTSDSWDNGWHQGIPHGGILPRPLVIPVEDLLVHVGP